MLSAAIYAMKVADATNSTTPANAPALFYAGIIMGYAGVDQKDNVLECFQPDQAMADSLDEFIGYLKVKDF